MKKNLSKILLLVGLLALVGAFFGLGLQKYLTLEQLKAQRSGLQALVEAQPWLYGSAFFLAYVLITGASLPGAAVMTLAAGAIFGTLKGVVIVSFASTTGATLAFLMARFLLRDWVQNKVGPTIQKMNDEIAKDGAFYLFTLRLVPVVPFFVINLAMGLTPIRTGTFYLVSQIGMLPGTAVYVNAGTQIGQLESIGGILTPQFIGSFVLLGLMPLIAKKAVAFFKNRKAA